VEVELAPSSNEDDDALPMLDVSSDADADPDADDDDDEPTLFAGAEAKGVGAGAGNGVGATTAVTGGGGGVCIDGGGALTVGAAISWTTVALGGLMEMGACIVAAVGAFIVAVGAFIVARGLPTRATPTGPACDAKMLVSASPVSPVPPVSPEELGVNGSPVGLNGLNELILATPGRTIQK
jgi:hypothetical protein